MSAQPNRALVERFAEVLVISFWLLMNLGYFITSAVKFNMKSYNFYFTTRGDRQNPCILMMKN